MEPWRWREMGRQMCCRFKPRGSLQIRLVSTNGVVEEKVSIVYMRLCIIAPFLSIEQTNTTYYSCDFLLVSKQNLRKPERAPARSICGRMNGPGCC